MSCYCSKTSPCRRPGGILDADALLRHLLELRHLLVTGPSRPFGRTQLGQIGLGNGFGCWELLPHGKGRGRVGILEDLREPRERLVAEGRQLILALRAFVDQLVAVAHEALKTHGSARRRQGWPRELGLVRDLDAFLQLVVQVVRQSQRIALVRFDQTTWAAVDVHAVHRNVQLA